jgi:hypothetical protein
MRDDSNGGGLPDTGKDHIHSLRVRIGTFARQVIWRAYSKLMTNSTVIAAMARMLNNDCGIGRKSKIVLLDPLVGVVLTLLMCAAVTRWEAGHARIVQQRKDSLSIIDSFGVRRNGVVHVNPAQTEFSASAPKGPVQPASSHYEKPRSSFKEANPSQQEQRSVQVAQTLAEFSASAAQAEVPLTPSHFKTSDLRRRVAISPTQALRPVPVLEAHFAERARRIDSAQQKWAMARHSVIASKSDMSASLLHKTSDLRRRAAISPNQALRRVPEVEAKVAERARRIDPAQQKWTMAKHSVIASKSDMSASLRHKTSDLRRLAAISSNQALRPVVEPWFARGKALEGRRINHVQQKLALAKHTAIAPKTDNPSASSSHDETESNAQAAFYMRWMWRLKQTVSLPISGRTRRSEPTHESSSSATAKAPTTNTKDIMPSLSSRYEISTSDSVSSKQEKLAIEGKITPGLRVDNQRTSFQEALDSTKSIGGTLADDATASRATSVDPPLRLERALAVGRQLPAVAYSQAIPWRTGPPLVVPEYSVTITPLVPTKLDTVRVRLRARDKVWAQIAADGQTVFSSVLYPLQSKLVEASERIKILVGNAGAVDIFLNDTSIGPIGPLRTMSVVEVTASGALVTN